jgi:hypothetical protein
MKPVPLLTAAAVGTGLLASMRLGHAIWILEQVIAITQQPSE